MTSLSIGSILPGAAATAAAPAPLAAASGAGTISRDTALSYAPDSSVNALAGVAASAAAQPSSAAGSITMPALQLTPVQQQPTTAPNSGGQNAPSSVVFQDAADPDAAP